MKRAWGGCATPSVSASAIVLALGGWSCGTACIENGDIVLHVPPDHTGDMCSVTVTGPRGQAVYAFPAWNGADVTCSVQHGPAPELCVRGQSFSFVPLDDHNAPAGNAQQKTVDAFLISFHGDPNATAAQAYFGSNDIDATLVCGATVIADHQLKHFQCTTPL